MADGLGLEPLLLEDLQDGADAGLGPVVGNVVHGIQSGLERQKAIAELVLDEVGAAHDHRDVGDGDQVLESVALGLPRQELEDPDLVVVDVLVVVLVLDILLSPDLPVHNIMQ